MDCFKSTPKHRKPASSLFLGLSFLLLSSFFLVSNFSDQSKNPISISSGESSDSCTGLHGFADYRSKCAYVRTHSSCSGEGYLNYLEIFYCTCSDEPVLGYAVLCLWLVVLFCVLGNTTAEYFCPAVENLSKLLKLPPTIAGTTLLPLGNGANDVFSSIISFMHSGAGEVGLNGVLGGALFVSCFVMGILSISISSRRVKVDETSFVRDILFFLFTLCCLLMLTIFGRVSFWSAVCFVCIYFLYIAVVSAMHYFYSKNIRVVNPLVLDEFGATATTPLLGGVDEEKGCHVSEKGGVQSGVHVPMLTGVLSSNSSPKCSYFWEWVVYILELPLFLPMRLTIPVVSEGKWSKPFAVCSVTLAPILLATLWNTTEGDHSAESCVLVYISAILIGIILGNLTLFSTNKSSPPNGYLFLWLGGGFLMSITWAYVLAEELVALLISFASILGISPSILGLTVLAWGNSVGDLIANLTLALKGGPDGAQIAMSGCYAGPLFNTLIGLGLSLVFAAWSEFPSEYIIPKSSDLYETLGFLMAGLLWALVILSKNNMVLDKSLGIGLLAIYFCFLFLRLVMCVGLFKIGDSL
ncbi:cation/calcium exchanger 1-like [Henckelia pumila]|uniref:cation/calcium exchanger 1-like n=1 Tax=Henckelia pumila TaxID=405737 RepID=UPI003C6DE298